jgi:hypothetical protein
MPFPFILLPVASLAVALFFENKNLTFCVLSKGIDPKMVKCLLAMQSLLPRRAETNVILPRMHGPTHLLPRSLIAIREPCLTREV